MEQSNIPLNRSATAKQVRWLSRRDTERRLPDLDFRDAHYQPIEY